MSDGAQPNPSRGVLGLPRDLTADQLAAAPILESLDALTIDDLTHAEADAFLDALDV